MPRSRKKVNDSSPIKLTVDESIVENMIMNAPPDQWEKWAKKREKHHPTTESMTSIVDRVVDKVCTKITSQAIVKDAVAATTVKQEPEEEEGETEYEEWQDEVDQMGVAAYTETVSSEVSTIVREYVTKFRLEKTNKGLSVEEEEEPNSSALNNTVKEEVVNVMIKNEVGGDSAGKYSCEYCEASFWSERAFNRHVNFKHAADDDAGGDKSEDRVVSSPKRRRLKKAAAVSTQRSTEEEESSNDDETEVMRMFYCDLCPSTFRTVEAFREHLTGEHGLTSKDVDFPVESDGGSDKEEEDAPILTCDWCTDAHFETIDALKSHLTQVHADRCNECQFCAMFFMTEDMYVEHVKSEHPSEDSRVLTCNFCEQKFGSASGKLKHGRKVHAESMAAEGEDGEAVALAAGNRLVSGDDGGRKKYQCEFCSVVYFSKTGMLTHMKRSHAGKCYTCETCAKSFRSETVYRNHMALEHSAISRKTLPCDFCPAKFASKNGQLKHMRKFHAKLVQAKIMWNMSRVERVFECDYCSAKHISQHGRRRHILMNHPEVAYQCEVCERLYLSKEQLEKHSIKHMVKGYECRYCRTMYVSKDSFRAHIRNAHVLDGSKFNITDFANEEEGENDDGVEFDKKTLDCTLCGKRFLNGDLFNEHMTRYHPKHECPICGVTKRRAFDLKIHILQHSEKRPFVCHICGKKFRSDAILKSHIQLHDQSQRFPCQICGKEFAMKYYLKRHLEVHKNNDSNSFPHYCQICGKGLKTVRGYKLHVEGHDEEAVAKRPSFECELCKKVLGSKSSLRLHMVIHEGSKPHVCDECGTAFARLQELQRHKEIHDDGNIYECSICLKQYPVMAKLRRHLQTCSVDGPITFTCENCGIEYKNQSTLSKHLKKCNSSS